MVKRIKEVQSVVAGHQQSISALQSTTHNHEQAITGLTAGVATGLAACKGVETRCENNLKAAIKSTEAKVSANTSSITATRSDITAIRNTLAGKK